MYLYVLVMLVGFLFLFLFLACIITHIFPNDQCFFKFIILMAISTDAQSINILDFNVLNNIH
jgi:hypothetical protein